MLFPMPMMYYKNGDYKKAKQMLERLDEVNPYVIDSIGSDEIYGEPIEYYSPGSEDEAHLIHMELFYLISSVPSFLSFVMEKMG